MNKRYCTNLFIPIVLLLAGITIYSCKDDVFDKEIVQKVYRDGFPVKDIDPNLDWNMTSEIMVNIIEYKDPAADTDEKSNYSIQIFDADPLVENSGAHLLAEGIANINLPFNTIIDCPKALTELYVCRIDAHKRATVKLVPIKNGEIQTSFGIPPTTSRTRSASTRADNSSITVWELDRTPVSIAALLPEAIELNKDIVIEENKVYKISKGTTYYDQITNYGIQNKPATIIIDGTWIPQKENSQLEKGIDLIVTENGKIKLKEDRKLTFIGSSRFIVFHGGSIVGIDDKGHESDDEGIIYLSNASDRRYNYNAGTIKIDELRADETGAVFYNADGGELYIDDLKISNQGSRLINHGLAVIDETTVNSTIENGCRLIVTDKLNGNLIMGDNCSALVKEYGKDGNSGKEIKLGNNSLLEIQEDAKFSYGTTFEGPYNGYALVKIGELKSINGFKHSGGYIYYEIKKEDIDDDWEKKTFLGQLMNSDGVLAKWGESPIVLPEGGCLGSGNTPNPGTEIQKDPMNYTYAFEDYFPLVGDYDFNDVVLDVAMYYKRDGDDSNPKNKVKSVNIDVTLVATGATKELGAGLRIIGIHPADISEIKCKGNADERFYQTFAGSFFMSGYGTTERWFDDEQGIIIPIFGNAHKAFQGLNITARPMINTQYAGGNSINNLKQYTYEIEIVLKDQSQSTPKISKKNLDFFIGYRYKSMKERMEVHLYEFWNQGPTKGGTIQRENLDLAGNNTWAICVPNFRYPKENINISISTDPSKGAYPGFLNWVKGDKDYDNWYLFPNEENVCR